MAYEQLKLDNQVCFRMYTAARLITSAYTPYFQQYGITYTQYLVLMLLWEKDNRVIKEITSKLFLETNTVTPLLKRMEKQGLTVSQKSKADSRQRIISLTKKGRDLEEQIKDIPNCIARNVAEAGMTTDDFTAMIPLLDKFIDILKDNIIS